VFWLTYTEPLCYTHNGDASTQDKYRSVGQYVRQRTKLCSMTYNNYREKLIQILYVSGKNNKWEFEYSWNYEENKFRESAYYAYHICYLPIAFPYQPTWKYTTNKQKNCQFCAMLMKCSLLLWRKFICQGHSKIKRI
jgi:hypothetical protein